MTTKLEHVDTPELTLVIPLYRSEDCAPRLVEELAKISGELSHEIIFVNDGSPDNVSAVIQREMKRLRVPARLIEHNRNFGEHNAVMTGYRHARGRYVLNLDDDLQNPIEEGLRLYRHACERDLDAVYSYYACKKHSLFRNFGSWFNSRLADFVVDKPKGFYLSSFRVVRGHVAHAIGNYQGPYPYIDGLLFQLTQRVGSLEVRHEDRYAGESNYNMRRLVRLWLNMVTSFSVMPLRIATVAGFLIGAVGFIGALGVLFEYFMHGIVVQGWASLMLAIIFFSGVQLIFLGLLGEYLGRIFLTVARKPQSFVRMIHTHDPASCSDEHE